MNNDEPLMTNDQATVAIWNVSEALKIKLDAFIEKSGEGNPKVKVQKQMITDLEEAGTYVAYKKWAVEGLRIRITKHMKIFDATFKKDFKVPEKPSKEQVEVLNAFIIEIRDINREIQEIIIREQF